MAKVGFFTAVSFGSLTETCAQSALETVDSYFYLGGKKACVIAGRVQNGKEDIVLAEGDSSCFLSALKVMSYFTIIIPVLALIVKAVLRYQNQFYVIDSRLINLPENASSQSNRELQGQNVISERDLDLARREVRIIDPKAELENGIQIAPNLIARIQQLMPKIKRQEEDPGIEWLSHRDTQVFRLTEAPNLVFKMFTAQGVSSMINGRFMNGEEQIRNRFNNMIKAKEICLTHRLGLITIPHAKMFEVEADRRTFPVIAEQSLNVQATESAQEELYRNHADDLGQAVRQLGTFIAETGFNDVVWRNIPVVDEAPGFQGARRIGLIDLEHMESAESGILGSWNGSCGLVRCLFSEEQMDAVLNDAKQKGIVSHSEAEQIKARRLEEIRSDRQLLDFYQRKGILADHRKRIEVDLNTLGLNLDEAEETKVAHIVRNGTDDGDELRYGTESVSMREVAGETIAEINRLIQETAENESVKGKRYILLDTHHGVGRNYVRLGRQTPWLRRIINALVEKGHLFKLVEENAHGYFIQA